MTELHTRYVKLAADVDRASADNGGTRVSVSRRLPSWTDHRSLFNQHQRRMSQVLKEWPDPGDAVFALNPHRGIAGRLWLAATSQLRAGTIGRHEAVDLHLPHDEELSLRHLLVLVRKSATSTRIQVMDLNTPSGFQAEQGGLLRSVDANGTLILRAASFSLVLVPTGAPTPWDRDAADPWSTLPPRVLVADEREANVVRRTLEVPARRRSETSVAFREGPSEPGEMPLLADRRRSCRRARAVDRRNRGAASGRRARARPGRHPRPLRAVLGDATTDPSRRPRVGRRGGKG